MKIVTMMLRCFLKLLPAKYGMAGLAGMNLPVRGRCPRIGRLNLLFHHITGIVEGNLGNRL